MVKIMPIFGTRPEAIKMAPVLRELSRYPHQFQLCIVVTAQHREMLDQVLRVFEIQPHYDLDIMERDQSLAQITTRSLKGLDPLIAQEKPDMVLVQGDTVTVFAAALTAFYHKVPIGHIEAGLRTEDKYNPFPEEMMRRLTTHLADLHFAPTETARQNLLREGISSEKIYVTGNTVIDALLEVAARLPDPEPSPYTEILVTAHRRENWGEPLRNICWALRDLVERFPQVRVTYALHRNPLIREIAEGILGGLERVRLIEPPDYIPFVQLMRASTLIITDSGGIQEEAPALGKPVLVVRRTTERPEGIGAGTVQLVGVKRENIVAAASRLLTDAEAYRQMAQARNPYGDGKAAQRIREALCHYFHL